MPPEGNGSNNRKVLKVKLEALSKKREIRDLKSNKKIHFKNLATSLLPLIDEKYLPSGQSIEDFRNTMRTMGQLLPAGSIMPHKKVSVPADMIYLEIWLSEGFFAKAVEPFVWLIVNSSEEHRLVIAWVRVDILKELAGLEAVRIIRPVMPPVMQ